MKVKFIARDATEQTLELEDMDTEDQEEHLLATNTSKLERLAHQCPTLKANQATTMQWDLLLYQPSTALAVENPTRVESSALAVEKHINTVFIVNQ